MESHVHRDNTNIAVFKHSNIAVIRLSRYSLPWPCDKWLLVALASLTVVRRVGNTSRLGTVPRSGVHPLLGGYQRQVFLYFSR